MGMGKDWPCFCNKPPVVAWWGAPDSRCINPFSSLPSAAYTHIPIFCPSLAVSVGACQSLCRHEMAQILVTGSQPSRKEATTLVSPCEVTGKHVRVMQMSSDSSLPGVIWKQLPWGQRAALEHLSSTKLLLLFFYQNHCKKWGLLKETFK